MVTIQFISYHASAALFILFAYLIPLLSSIRTVYNKDYIFFKFWTTYWFLLYIFTPILSIFKVSKYIQLMFVMWLSLPQFQGALFVYHQIFEPVMEKYNLEQKVDKKIQGAYHHVRLIMWRIFTDLSWSVLGQVGELVSLVKGTSEEPVCEEDCKKETEDRPREETNVVAESIQSTFTRKPSHSIMDSISSNNSSMDSLSESLGTDMYKNDFLDILKQGLYVFAHTGAMPKRFRLRILHYECIDDGTNECFVLEVDPNVVIDAGDECVTVIPFHTISSVEQSGSNSIKLMSHSQLCTSLKDEVLLTEIVLSDEQDQQTFLQGLYACLPHVRATDRTATATSVSSSSDQSM